MNEGYVHTVVSGLGIRKKDVHMPQVERTPIVVR